MLPRTRHISAGFIAESENFQDHGCHLLSNRRSSFSSSLLFPALSKYGHLAAGESGAYKPAFIPIATLVYCFYFLHVRTFTPTATLPSSSPSHPSTSLPTTHMLP
ncbi:hypothetical protein E2C01_088868 [Portunus trituberculatus]|uniref:Uncharacterized protein n=1 Tax=Portunus trituberculatus TaxID=210409 RepID=A0A5B7JL07_PORTR|nr:hypothetical protein [Portunus trituberculatus]